MYLNSGQRRLKPPKKDVWKESTTRHPTAHLDERVAAVRVEPVNGRLVERLQNRLRVPRLEAGCVPCFHTPETTESSVAK